MAILTFSGIVVSLFMVVQYFDYLDSWKVTSATDVAFLCFYILDMLLNLSIGINTYWCQSCQIEEDGGDDQ